MSGPLSPSCWMSVVRLTDIFLWEGERVGNGEGVGWGTQGRLWVVSDQGPLLRGRYGNHRQEEEGTTLRYCTGLSSGTTRGTVHSTPEFGVAAVGEAEAAGPGGGGGRGGG